MNLCYYILSRLNAVRQLIVPFHFLFIYINNFTPCRELYVGDQGSHAVQICGLDGRDCRELNVTDGSATFWPNQITIDHVSEYVPAWYLCPSILPRLFSKALPFDPNLTYPHCLKILFYYTREHIYFQQSSEIHKRQ